MSISIIPKKSLCQFVWHWEKQKLHIEHEYTITGWALCVMSDVTKDVAERMKDKHRDAIELVVCQLHLLPKPNLETSSLSVADLLDTFWNKFKAYQNCTNPYHDKMH